MTTAIGLVVALATHSIFEGIALGLIEKKAQVSTIAVGMVVHKAAEVISLGGTLARSQYTLK